MDLEKCIACILVEHGLPDDKGFLYKVAMAESAGGKHLVQLGGGPGRGYFQFERPTVEDILNHLRDTKAADFIRKKIKNRDLLPLVGENLITYDLEFQVVLARVHLMRFRETIPSDMLGQAKYWKKYWNTYLGAGTLEHFMEANGATL